MRKGTTRGMINRTFIEYTCKVKAFNRSTSKSISMNQTILVDKYEESKNIEDMLQKKADPDIVILKADVISKDQVVYSMSKEDFIKHDKIL